MFSNYFLIRRYCCSKKPYFSSNDIRRIFLDFFIDRHQHKFVRSSPVVPFNDKTVAFTNAGMNQFKSIFLNKTVPQYQRATNSQKCIRVGGKHNDLSIVGQDGYHHTFFEMLGNWSFGDYFKEKACAMALEVLRGPYMIDTSRLYFTYFAGDEKLNIPADLECYEIWRKLGISDNRILPFGLKDNFWEMGQVGPCGPCTEIHIDHIGSQNRSNLVNANRSDLTELWNIVFIEYNRNDDGTIQHLPQQHIDTGMGFERLVAILQSKTSNYDTDLFYPIIEKIQKVTNASQYKGFFSDNTNKYHLDTAYRILADHSRMITACLSDGMLPEQNQKLRRVLRTALLISENSFNHENLLQQILPQVVQILGPTYPEMSNKLNTTLEIVNHEQEIFKALRLNSSKEIQEILGKHKNLEDIDVMELPGFVPAYKDLLMNKKTFTNNKIPGNQLFKLYDTYGLNDDAIRLLGSLENLDIDTESLAVEKLKNKQKSKNHFNVDNHKTKINELLFKCTLNMQNTKTEYKYDYKFNAIEKEYEVPVMECKILKIISNNAEYEKFSILQDPNESLLCLITDKSNFYVESGGQESDIGIIRFKGADYYVDNVQEINNNVIHFGKFRDLKNNFEIQVGDNVEMIVDSKFRTHNVFHHTATHLLNAAVRKLFNRATYQMSSLVNHRELRLDLGIIGEKLTTYHINKIEHLIKEVINAQIPTNVSIVDATDIINKNDIVLVPGEIYPETNLRLITIQDDNIGFVSKELCCGTHVQNTKHLKNFCITNLKQINRAHFRFTAVAGTLAEQCLELANIYLSRINKLESALRIDSDKHILMDDELQKIKNKLLHSELNLPFAFKVEILERINGIMKRLKETTRTTLKEFIGIEMQNVLQQKNNEPFIIHFLDSSLLVESVPLQKATKLCTNRPIMVISLNDNMIKARCCIPTIMINDKFTAINWLNEFASVFDGQCSPPKGQSSKEVCNMKAKKIISHVFEDMLELAMQKANNFALKQM